MKKLALLLVMCLVGVFVLTTGCTQSLTASDQAFANAVTNGANKLTPIIQKISDHSRSQELSLLKQDGQNLEREARTQYTIVSGITPDSSDLLRVKQKYLNAMEMYQEDGQYISEGADAAIRGDYGLATLNFDAAIAKANEARINMEEATDIVEKM